MKFRAELKLAGKTATGIEVPPKIVDRLGSGKRPAVVVTIEGYTYRSTIAPLGGQFMLPVSAEHREGAGIAPGDTVTVEVELDTAPRQVVVPPELERALAKDRQAKRVFEGLSYSARQRHVQPIERAKTEETRKRRIAATLKDLREAKG